MGTPLITVFVRNASGRKYARDQFIKRCSCRKLLRWTHNGVKYREATGGNRGLAQRKSTQVEDQLSEPTPAKKPGDEAHGFQESGAAFINEKRIQGLTPGVIGKYTGELARLSEHRERNGLCGIQCDMSGALSPNYTLARVGERCRSFLRYWYVAQMAPPHPSAS